MNTNFDWIINGGNDTEGTNKEVTFDDLIPYVREIIDNNGGARINLDLMQKISSQVQSYLLTKESLTQNDFIANLFFAFFDFGIAYCQYVNDLGDKNV